MSMNKTTIIVVVAIIVVVVIVFIATRRKPLLSSETCPGTTTMTLVNLRNESVVFRIEKAEVVVQITLEPEQTKMYVIPVGSYRGRYTVDGVETTIDFSDPSPEIVID